jgi:hypothetical protein
MRWKAFFTGAVDTNPALPERRWSRAFTRELLAFFAVYSVTLVLSLLVADSTRGPLRVAVALIPMVPFSVLGWIVLRALRRVDERERSMMYRAVALAFFATAVVSFAYGFLENTGAPRLSMFVVWPTMASFWVVGRWIAPWMP